MTRDIDLLTSPALSHLRDRWWDAAFTEFVGDTLRPQPGERVLEVGCGTGIADLMLGLLQPGGIQYFGVDLNRGRLRQARGTARDHDQPLDAAAADVRQLPFRNASFDALFEAGVLQHVPDPSLALSEIARVMRPGGRVLLVEPDNAHRYWFSSLPSGMRAFELATELFAVQRYDERERRTNATPDAALGPHLPALGRAHGIDAIAVHLFPVTMTRLGAPVPAVWQARRDAARRIVEGATSDVARDAGRAFVDAVNRYADEGAAAGASFVEIQNAMLFAMVGQRRA